MNLDRYGSEPVCPGCWRAQMIGLLQGVGLALAVLLVVLLWRMAWAAMGGEQ